MHWLLMWVTREWGWWCTELRQAGDNLAGGDTAWEWVRAWLSPPASQAINRAMQKPQEDYSIGVLDIYGFEIFQVWLLPSPCPALPVPRGVTQLPQEPPASAH